ncbi:MAG: hypothetical protein ACOYVK_21590 [Bacillota bacterium]
MNNFFILEDCDIFLQNKMKSDDIFSDLSCGQTVSTEENNHEGS